MRVIIRSVLAVAVALASVVALALAWTAATAVQLAATALIMGGSDDPLAPPKNQPDYINPYLSNAVNIFINPAAAVPSGADGGPIQPADGDVYAVLYPAEFFPVFGSETFGASVREGRQNLNDCARGSVQCIYNDDPAIDFGPPVAPPVPGEDLVIFGFSQSAVVASLVKRDLIENPREGDGVTSMFLLANPMRPNGGILVLGPQGVTIPLLDIPFYGATPTNSCEVGDCIATVDVATQYDPLGGDSPSSLNMLAIINALVGAALNHGKTQYADFADAVYQGSYGDTDYYLLPAKRLPILTPFSLFVPSPILTALDAPLRAAIEGAYHRDINPGVPVGLTWTSLLPFHDPVRTIINILRAIPVGLDDAIAELTGDPDFRPFGTTPVTSPYGVGGPDLPPPPEDGMGLMATRGTSDDGFGDGFGDSDAAGDDDGLDDLKDDLKDEETGAVEDPDPVITETGLPKVRGPIEFESAVEEDDDPEESTTPVSGTQEPDPEPTDTESDADGDPAGE